MRIATLAAFAAGLAATSHPGTADAHIRKERSRLSGNSAVATWSYQEGEVATFLSVVVNEGGQGDAQRRFATVTLLRSNVVTGHVLVAGVADLSDLDITVDPQLGRAHLRAEGLFEDDTTLTFFPLTVELSWTATADAVRQDSHDSYREPGFAVRTQALGLARAASVAGTVYGDDTELVSGPPQSALIQRNETGAVSIQISKCGER
jgi:hypothetical protein